MQGVASTTTITRRAKFTNGMRRNGAKNRRSRRCDAAKERLMQNCNEACKRGNRCNTINPQSSTFLYSIQDYGPDRHSNGATNSYHGIIEVGVPAHDDAPWKTTLEHIRNMHLDGKIVSLTNISAACTNVPNRSWIDVVTAFHESGAKSVGYDNSQIELTRDLLSDTETVEKNFGDTGETVSI